MSDLSPVARISATVVTLNAPQSMNIKSFKELADMAKAQPGKLNWATITGATDLIVAAWLKKAGIDMQKVPYRNPVQALTDVGEGRLHLYSAAYAIVRPQIQAGRVQLLAVSSTKRVSMLPDVPTITEAGFPDLTFDGLVGVFGQRDMPLVLRERIASDVREALLTVRWQTSLSPAARRWCRARPSSCRHRSTNSSRRSLRSPRRST